MSSGGERDWMEQYHEEGDENAFRRLFELYRIKIWSLILSRGVPLDAAKSLLQDVAIAFAMFLREKQVPDHCSGLIYRIAHHKIADHFRRSGEPTVPLDTVEEHLATERTNPMNVLENRQLSHQMLFQSGVTEDQRQALLLHYWLGYTIPQVATQLEVSKDTVKTRLYLARKKIRAYLEKQERRS